MAIVKKYVGVMCPNHEFFKNWIAERKLRGRAVGSSFATEEFVYVAVTPYSNLHGYRFAKLYKSGIIEVGRNKFDAFHSWLLTIYPTLTKESILDFDLNALVEIYQPILKIK